MEALEFPLSSSVLIYSVGREKMIGQFNEIVNKMKKKLEKICILK